MPIPEDNYHECTPSASAHNPQALNSDHSQRTNQAVPNARTLVKRRPQNNNDSTKILIDVMNVLMM